jgi:phosphate transport system substrate-binding protein
MEIILRKTALGLAGLLGVMLATLPAMATGSLTLRDRLTVAGTFSTEGVGRMLAQRFAEGTQGAHPPQLEVMRGSEAFERFCAGIGPDTPDFALVSRRMPRGVMEHCRANGVTEVVELRLGYSAVVLAARRGDIAPALTSRQIYEALAAERTSGEGFEPNRTRLWSEIDPSLPPREIRMLVPEAGTGMRALMEDLMLEAGCREVRAIRLLFEASYRRSKCVTLREDQRAVPVAHGEIMGALLAAPPGTIAVLSYDQLLRAGGNLLPLRLDGVLPDAAGIATLDYNQAQVVFLYAKRQHLPTREGVGVVQGLRALLTEATSERAAGPGGYLGLAGLVPLPPAERHAQRRVAERLSLRSR